MPVLQKSQKRSLACSGELPYVMSLALVSSSKITPSPWPNLAGRLCLSFSSAAGPCEMAVASSSRYDGCHG